MSTYTTRKIVISCGVFTFLAMSHVGYAQLSGSRGGVHSVTTESSLSKLTPQAAQSLSLIHI